MRALIGPALAGLLCCAQPAVTQPDYPARPISLVVALAAGTGMDVVARLYAEKLSRVLGRPVIVENKPGSAGLVAVESVLSAPADGYTLGAATSAIMAIRPSLFKKPPYDPTRDFVPISLYLKSPFILVINPLLPVHSVSDLIAYVKAHPGQVSFSSSSVGGAPHLAAEYMKQRFGLDMSHVPYKNSPQSITDVAAGHVSLAFAEAGASLPLIKDGNQQLPPDKFRVTARVNKERQAFENVAVRLREAFRLALIVKLKSGEADLDFASVDPRYAPPITALHVDGEGSVLFFKVGGAYTATRTDFTRVTPYSERFKVKLAPLQFLDF